MKTFKKYTLLFSPLLLSILLTIFAFGFKAFKENSIEINIHDTYFVLSSLYFVLALTIFFSIIIYTSWYLYYTFKNNKITNILFLVLVQVLVVAFSFLMILNNQYVTPDISSKELKYNYPITSTTNMAIIQFAMVILVTYSAFKIGQKFKHHKNEN